MFDFFIEEHIVSKRLYKNTILHYELVYKKTQNIQD